MVCITQYWTVHPPNIYMIANNSLQIIFGYVSASDEGIYGCLDTNHRRYPVGCLRVYGESCYISMSAVPQIKAAHHLYALARSCPCSTSCKYNDLYYNIIHYIGRAAFASEETETLALPANGGSVSFNATVIYTSGGSCNYRQNLRLIRLRKINERTLSSVCTCKFNRGPSSCHPNETTVNLSRGHSGSEFVLTLFNLTTDSRGTYEVSVESSHPGSGSILQLIKRFHLVGK